MADPVCQTKWNQSVFNILDYVNKNYPEGFTFNIADVLRELAKKRVFIDISRENLSYHIKLLCSKGILKSEPDSNSDRRFKPLIITKHGVRCLNCQRRRNEGNFVSPDTEGKKAGCVFACD